jgi:hypothetical protein
VSAFFPADAGDVMAADWRSKLIYVGCVLLPLAILAVIIMAETTFSTPA